MTIQGELKADKVRAASVDLAEALTVFLRFNLRTGEITAPSEVTAETISAAFSSPSPPV